jgi:hypothetical protein
MGGPYGELANPSSLRLKLLIDQNRDKRDNIMEQRWPNSAEPSHALAFRHDDCAERPVNTKGDGQ